MNVGEAKAIIGSLSFEGKLPGSSFSISAFTCKTGAKLAKIPGTVCADCYAKRDHYTMPNPVKAMTRRLAGLSHPRWVEAMAFLLNHTHAKGKIRVDLGLAGVKLARAGGSRWRYNDAGHHRWHGSGDLQSVEHLARICEVARLTPMIKHWLPTQELSFVRRFTSDQSGVIPDNLVVRASSIFMNDEIKRAWTHTSSVVSADHKVDDGSYVCPAPMQSHRCMDCRACWNPAVKHVVYRAH